MREIWCSDCEKWITYNPDKESKAWVRKIHRPWCNLEFHLLETHPDLVKLNRLLDRLYIFPA